MLSTLQNPAWTFCQLLCQGKMSWSIVGKKCLSCSASPCLSPVTSFLGHIQAGLSTVQGRVRSFSLPARGGGNQWDLPPVDTKPQPPPQTVEAVGGGDQAQQEDQDGGSQRDPDQGAAGTFPASSFAFGYAPHGLFGERCLSGLRRQRQNINWWVRRRRGWLIWHQCSGGLKEQAGGAGNFGFYN